MKRLSYSFLAIVIATVTFAFKTANTPKNLLQTRFHYIAPATNPYSEINVEDENNWEEQADVSDCSGAANKACSILVDNSNTTLVSGTRYLNFSLNAKQGAAMGSDYVPDLTATSQIVSAVNKQN